MSSDLLEVPAVSEVLLGDEAVALGAIHSGVSAAYGYPGTPSTEILEYLLKHESENGGPHAAWCANEKTAYETALGVSMMGQRTLVTMKHVGLNVAADPFMNSALLPINGGLVVAVADDPGMHSSQNEQDSRYFAGFALIPCLEPADQQEAYWMTREAFDLSERYRVPVMIRLVTRLAHSRAVVRAQEPEGERPVIKPEDTRDWILLPVNARRRWREHLNRLPSLRSYVDHSPFNRLVLNPDRRDLGLITTGIARNYVEENLGDLGWTPSHLHIGVYPFPRDLVRDLAAHVDTILVFEEGYPFLERYMRGVFPGPVAIQGKETGDIPPDGELSPDTVRQALGLPVRAGVGTGGFQVAPRPPKLCQGCPHADTYTALRKALEGIDGAVVMADIGCYTLGALPPYSAIESCVCMGASIGMARGAAQAGTHPSIAIIGDSTFLHSGVTPLMDAISEDTNMTVVILDNETVGMTGGQDTILPASNLQGVVEGLGVPEEHLRVVTAHPKKTDEMAAVLREEIEHPGLSVYIAVRECIQTARRKKSASR